MTTPTKEEQQAADEFYRLLMKHGSTLSYDPKTNQAVLSATTIPFEKEDEILLFALAEKAKIKMVEA
jgi:hypothetical protein